MKKARTLKEIITEFKSIHGDEYDYSLVHETYMNSSSRITIICKKHGPFEQKVASHTWGNRCKRCATADVARKRPSRKISTDEFIKRSNKIHKGKNDYGKSEYNGNNVKLIITCPIHGDFEQTPRHHYNSKGCYSCGRDSTGKKLTSYVTKEDFIERAVQTQIEEYDYSNLPEMVKVQGNIIIRCLTHGKFRQKAYAHMVGHGCSKCCYRGHSRSSYVNHCDKYGYECTELYLIRIYNDEESFIKIGITSSGLKERFRKLKSVWGYNYDIIKVVKLTPGNAWDAESQLKSKYISNKHIPKKEIPGYTECFNKDIISQILKDFDKYKPFEEQLDKEHNDNRN